MDELRALGQSITALPKAALVGTVAQPPALLLAASEDTGVDAGRVLRESVTSAGGRGGGSPRVAQGTVPDSGRLADVARSIMSVL